MKKTVALAGAAIMLAMPATASASSSIIPVARTAAADQCAEARATYRTTIANAQDAKQAAFRAAKLEWRTSVADERIVLRDALADAETVAERRAARKQFIRSTGEERRARGLALKSAVSEFHVDKSDARSALRAGLKECRS